MTLGQLLKERRAAKGFTQKQVADILGVAGQYISDIECNRKLVGDVRRLLTWATYLGISNRELLETV